jgi:hypothetical protein
MAVNPYLLPPDQQGWRGESIPGAHKRKWYTLVENDTCLVTALLLIPGEVGIRHSHESGELSVHFSDEMRPEVSWNPPGVVHGGVSGAVPNPVEAAISGLMDAESLKASGNPEFAKYISGILEAHINRVEELIEQKTKPAPAPRVIVDILFPPFKTTIVDPGVADGKTVTGQWYD